MPPDNLDFFAILECLAHHHVDFIIVGGVSALLNGAPVMTLDLDIVHARSAHNIEALCSALKELHACYRYHPNRIEPSPSHLSSPGHQLLQTSQGPLDVLGMIDEGKGYEELILWSHEVYIAPHVYHVLDLDRLIEVKERANRDKDRAVLPVLRATLKEQ